MAETVASKLFAEMKSHLIEHEGCVQHLYLDVHGHITIGIGHLVLKTNKFADEKLLGEELEVLLQAKYGAYVERRKTPVELQEEAWKACFANGPVASSKMMSRVPEWAPAGLTGACASTSPATPADMCKAPVWAPLSYQRGGPLGMLGASQGTDLLQDSPLERKLLLYRDARDLMKLAPTQASAKSKAKATKYTGYTRVWLTQKGMEELAKDDVLGKINGNKKEGSGLRVRFKGFDKYPLNAQMALVDIGFQYGLDGAHKRLGAHAQAGEWEKAAAYWKANYHEGRDRTRVDWLTKAAKAAASATLPTLPPGPAGPATKK